MEIRIELEEVIQCVLYKSLTTDESIDEISLLLENKRSEQLRAFADWWVGLSQEELVWYEGRYVEVFLSQ